jgi:putative ABC transport system permease protein
MSPRWLSNLRELLTHERKDADLERELQSHLAVETEDQLEAGVPPDEAPYAARRALGNVTRIEEETRSSWPFGWLGGLFTGIRQDLRYGVRSFWKQPAFTAAAVIALALGIGATTTIFSVIQNVLLDPYPMYTDVDRIINVSVQDATASRPGGRTFMATPELLEYRDQAASFQEIIAGTSEPVIYTGPEGTEQFVGGLTTGNTFTFMGVAAEVGRTLTMQDVKPDASPVFVMSYKLWAGRFGMDRSVIGRTFILNGVATTLVGVMPPRVSKLGADMWRPIRLDRADPAMRERFFMFQARLKPGVTIDQAEAEMNLIAQRVSKIFPQYYPAKFRIRVLGIIDHIVGRFRTTLYTMAAAVALLLLIACANVANLLLSRAAAREREMALRASIGASRARLVRQLLAESLLLALLGVVVGWAFAQLGITFVTGAIPEGLIPRESLIRLDTRVLAFSLAVAAVTVLIFGLAPALHTVKRDLLNPMKDASKGIGGFRRGRLSSALVVAEIALSIVLLNSAGLLMRSFMKLQNVDLGLNPENVLFVGLPIGVTHRTATAQHEFIGQVLSRIRTLPGVTSAASTSAFPIFGALRRGFDIKGIEHEDRWRASIDYCSDDYFRTMGIRLLRGRVLSAEDVDGGRNVAVVNETLVERHLRGADPIGQVITLSTGDEQGRSVEQAFDIVGVVAAARNQGLRDSADPAIFLPYSVAPPMTGRGLVLKTAGPPMLLVPSVKREVWAVDRGIPVGEAAAVTEYMKRFGYAEPRLGLFVFSSFALIGLVLVALGVYSLVSYTVARQTHEIGIRMAVGASRLDVLRTTMGLAARWIGLGVLTGVVASLATMRLLESQLWQVTPSDPSTIVAVVGVILVSGLLASYLPALRATRVDPMVVLRYE